MAEYPGALDPVGIVADLAETHPARLTLDMHSYECSHCNVACDPDTRVNQLDVSDHSPDCLWRRARMSWQLLLDEDAALRESEAAPS